MKRYFLIICVALTAIALLPSCRSKQAATATADALIGAEEATWTNVSMPVKLELLEPQKFSLSGRATLVRGEYVYISLRMLGFEVGQVYVDPTEADIVVKQLNRMWIQQPLGDRFTRLGLPFSLLQEAMLGRPEAIERLPEGLDLTVGGTETTAVLTLRMKAGGKTLIGRMTLSLGEAQWDSPRPAGFSAPGSDYKKTDLKGLKNALSL